VYSADPTVRGVFVVGIFFWGIGALLINTLTGFRPARAVMVYRLRPVTCGVTSARNLYVTLVVAFGVATLLSLYYYSQVGISIFHDEVGYERLVRRHATGGSYVLQRVFRVMMPILCVAYFGMRYCASTRRYYSNLKFAMAVLVTSAFLLFTGMRGNLIIFLFMPFLVALGLIDPNLRIRNLILALILTFMGGYIVTALMFPDLSSGDLMMVIAERISTGASDGIWYVITEDYETNGPYWGMTYANDLMSLLYKLGLMNSEAMAYGAKLAESMLGSAYNGEQAAVYYLGELYANFGMSGVVVGSVFIGAALQIFYRSLLRRRKSVLYFGASVYFGALILPILGGPTLSMLVDYTITVSGCYFALLLVNGLLQVMRGWQGKGLLYS
jgi:oligosaccharide repeat unit polymerase